MANDVGWGGKRVGSGPKARTLTAQEVVKNLRALSPMAVRVLRQQLKDGNWEAARWVLEQIVGKPMQPMQGTVLYQSQINLLVERQFSLTELLALRDTALKVIDSPTVHPGILVPQKGRGHGETEGEEQRGEAEGVEGTEGSR